MEKYENNFWETSDLKLIEPFKDFYKSDKSKNKTRSSLVMWCIYYIYNRKSDLYYISEKEEIVKRDILQDSTYSIPENLAEAYSDAVLTQSEKSLLVWEQMMYKRDKVLKETEYTLDKPLSIGGEFQTTRSGQVIMVPGTADQLDKANRATPAMMKDLIDIKSKLLNEDAEIDPSKMSLSESNEI
mgnify:CR=1 FL=1|tara:strand:+ start:300 stop:854 length:555 start_codon:yes stop_codon:yes gene_type:complete